jgi:two-component system alkaline phosphatase synthesis response regulator PhoP
MIFFVEDDTNIRDLVIYTLTNSGFDAKGFPAPSRFYEAMDELASKGRKPELILLDIMLPEEDGLSILKKLRADPVTEDIPIMMLTARGNEYDKVIGLDNGADDYMPKPFGMMELVARVKALLRRNHTVTSGRDGEIRIGPIALSPGRRTVTVDDRNVDLTYKEFELLKLLMENRGIVFSRDKLLSSVWGYSFTGESRTVDVHVRTLRQKLGDAGDMIETVRGVGYKFRAED